MIWFAAAWALVAAASAFAAARGVIAWWGTVLAIATMGTIAVFAVRGLTDHPHARFGAANVITLARAIVTCLLIALFAAPPGLNRWALAIVALLLVAADGLDGWVARRQGLASAFGARFDMEIDALAGLTLAILLATQGIVGPWVILVGLPRYPFIAAGWVWPALRAPLPPSQRRRIVCVIQNGALALAFAPDMPPALVAAIGLAAVAWSFAVDIAWLLRRQAVRPG